MLTFLLILVVSGCSHARGSGSAVHAGEVGHTHRVRYRGETLGGIAAWYTGSSANWEKLAAMNPKIDPKSLQIGDKVSIPRSLLKRTEPLPKSVASLNAGTKLRTPPAAKGKVAPEEDLESEIVRDRLVESLLQRDEKR